MINTLENSKTQSDTTLVKNNERRSFPVSKPSSHTTKWFFKKIMRHKIKV